MRRLRADAPAGPVPAAGCGSFAAVLRGLAVAGTRPPHLRAPKRSRGRFAVLALLLIGVFAVAGCGGSSGGDEKTVPAASATVSVKKIPGYGDALVTSSGSPVYLFTGDPSGSSACKGACVKQWPPLTATGAPTAGPGAKSSLLSTFTRADGDTQVLYNGHALYTSKDSALQAGTESDGGAWYLVSPSGEAIETTESGGY